MFSSNSNSNANSHQQHLPLPNDMESHYCSEHDVKNREDENADAIMGGGNENMEPPPSSGSVQQPKRRRYIRHTAQQKQQMEAFFLECPHPDDRQRRELGKLVGLNSMQIKFWFQNKRTQAKNQQERNENEELRAENKELRAENESYKQILSNTICRDCGGLPPPEMIFEDQQMRAENELLREEIERVKRMMADLAIEPNNMAGTSLNQRVGNVTSQHNNMSGTLLNQVLNVPSQDNNMLLSLLNQGVGNLQSQDNNMPQTFLSQELGNLPTQENNIPPSLLNQGLDNLLSQDNNMPPSSLNQGLGNLSSEENNMPSSLLNQGLSNLPSQDNNVPPSLLNQELDNLLFQENDMPSSLLNQEIGNGTSQNNNMPLSSLNQEVDHGLSQHNNMYPSSLNQGAGNVLSQHNNIPSNLLNEEIDTISSEEYNMLLGSLTHGIDNMASQDNNTLSGLLAQGIDNMSSQDNNNMLSGLLTQGTGNGSSQHNNMPSNSLYQGIDDIPSQQNSMPLRSTNLGVGGHGAQPAGIVGEMSGGGSDPLKSLTVPADSSDKPMIVELAVESLEELTRMAPSGPPLWARGKYNADILNEHEYFRTFPRGIGPKPLGFKFESSRESMVISMNHINLIEILMDVDQWSRVFCSIVSRAAVLEVVSNGLAGSYDGWMQVMSAEFQFPSPFVPPREYDFLRYCKQLPDGSWAVVDVSLETIRPSGKVPTSRRRPSGCLIEALPNGFSTKVTWVEHVEVDDRALAPHTIYKPLVDSGLAFGARRWMASLKRQCQRIAASLATHIPQGQVISREGRKGLLKLAERMVMSFYSGVGASTAQAWTTLTPAGCHNNIRIITRKDKDEPGRPTGIVIGAATSFRLSIPSRILLDSIRSTNFRSEWDVLVDEGYAEEFARIENGHDPANCVSLLGVKSSNPMHSTMVILQESFTDSTGSFVVYAPIDIVSFNALLVGGQDPDTIAMLPSGFVILPNGGTIATAGSGGCLVTVALQILIESDITKRISLCSVSAVNTVVKNTVEKIKVVVTRNIT